MRPIPHPWYAYPEYANIITVRLITPHGGTARAILSVMPDEPNRTYGACLDVLAGAHDHERIRDVLLWAVNFAVSVSFELNSYERITEFLMDADYFERFEDGWRP